VKRTQIRQAAMLAEAADARNEIDHGSPDGDLLILLEDSICELSAADRELIVRRFYRQESFVQLGESLQISADAARKRVNRVLLDLQRLMLRDGWDSIPETLFAALKQSSSAAVDAAKAAIRHKRIDEIVKGTVTMVELQEALEFSVVSAEFFVKDVEANIAFFEKLGFRRRYVESVDAMGRIPRASLVAGVGRIWLRRADESEGTRPSPGVTLFFWIDGGAEGLIAHRKRIVDEGVSVSTFTDDISLRNFTVVTPDGYTIGFFMQYR
jgi:catechol 2,3-dioxygenase-like lactoylglutathione lyase family enzyme